MRLSWILTLLLSSPAFSATSSGENLCKSNFFGVFGTKLEQMVPKDWKLLSKTVVEGDVDGDGRQDTAAVFERTTPQGELFPRVIAVFFMNEKGIYHLATCSAKFNLTRDAEAFNDNQLPAIKLSKKSVEITISGGTVWITTDVYKFRYEKKEFRLIGSTHTMFQSTQAEDTKRSIDTNYVTGQYEIKSSVPDSKPLVKKQLSKKVTAKLNDFSPDSEKEVLKIMKGWSQGT